MDALDVALPPRERAIVERFVALCRDDPRVLAAVLAGSHARGAADAHSDLDLDVVTSDADHQAFCADAAAFLRQLSEPLFLEDFDLPGSVFFIFADGIEGELAIGRDGDLGRLHAGPYRVLLDRAGVLTGGVRPWPAVDAADQVERLRRLVQWFWHDLSHFITAMARGQLWWAYGQLEILRRVCVDLLWLGEDFSRRPEAYDKVELVVPAEQMAPLAATCCPLAYGPMLAAGRTLLQVFRDVAPALAREHGMRYPTELDRLLSDRLTRLPPDRA